MVFSWRFPLLVMCVCLLGCSAAEPGSSANEAEESVSATPAGANSLAGDVDISTRDDGFGGTREVRLPDHPFYTDFAYTGAVAQAAQTTNGVSRAWFTTSDAIEDVTAYYTQKFTDVDKPERAGARYYYVSRTATERLGAIIEKQENGVQITLTVDPTK